MNMKIIAVVACIVLALMMFAPLITPVKASPAVMSTLQYRYFSSQDAVWTALLTPDSQGGIDSMQWTMTASEYNSAVNNKNLVVEPLSEAGEDEIAFNNNLTDGVHMNVRSPMNFTDFRNALNCLVDKQGVITGPMQGGFATQCDSQVPYPLMSGYVNPAITGANYPWKFNETNALSILYRGGWYSHTEYPTFSDLLTAFTSGALATAGGTTKGVVYTPNDPFDQWGGGDTSPMATIYATQGVANTPIFNLEGWVRQGDARKNLGEFFIAELQKIGCPVHENAAASISQVYPVVMDAQTYDFATLGYSMGSPPSWLYTEVTEAGIGYDLPNVYLIQDGNISQYATAMWVAQDAATFLTNCETVQYNLVMESYLVPAYCPATYCAYKSSLLGQVDIIGQGAMANGGAAENWITLDARKNNTIAYTGPASGAPESNIFYLGIYNAPNMLNPIFESSVYDFQVTDEIFSWPMNGNPYTIAVGSAITGAPAGGDLPWMVTAWKTQIINNPENPSATSLTEYESQWTNVTLWFRNDITWQDGVPFTVDDINYTIYLQGLYGDAYDAAAMTYALNTTGANPTYAPYFTKINDFTCSILVKSPSFLNLYIPFYCVVPYHLYKYIVPSDIAAAEAGTSKDGLHGLWPGQAATADNILPGAPFTLSDLQNKPETTLVGTGPWMYRPGTTSASSFTAGGGITLDAYPNFFMTIAPGAIALKYTWLNTDPNAQPSGGYYKIGLPDLVYLANAYGTTGTPPSTVAISSVPGAPHSWNPAADLAAPAGVIGLSDLVTLALHYGWYFGNYSYNAPYPASEIANGGP